MAFCRKCGAALNEGTGVCHACGAADVAPAEHRQLLYRLRRKAASKQFCCGRRRFCRTNCPQHVGATGAQKFLRVQAAGHQFIRSTQRHAAAAENRDGVFPFSGETGGRIASVGSHWRETDHVHDAVSQQS